MFTIPAYGITVNTENLSSNEMYALGVINGRYSGKQLEAHDIPGVLNAIRADAQRKFGHDVVVTITILFSTPAQN